MRVGSHSDHPVCKLRGGSPAAECGFSLVGDGPERKHSSFLDPPLVAAQRESERERAGERERARARERERREKREKRERKRERV